MRQKEARLREYYLQYSDDGSNWLDYTTGGERKASLALEKEFPSLRTQEEGGFDDEILNPQRESNP